MPKDNETISFRVSVRGSKDLWWNFVSKVRENKKKKDKDLTIWKVLEKLIRNYLAEE